MKTILYTSIFAFVLSFISITASAEGTDSSSLNTANITVNKIVNFAFRLDNLQILKEAQNTDLSDLNQLRQDDSDQMQTVSKPFAFSLDPKQIQEEAQNTDLSELK